MQVLTVLPSRWRSKKIQDEFGVTDFMARAAKKLAKDKGVLSTPNPKPGRSVAETIVEHVKQFYESDGISCQMAGKRDCVAMTVNGEKVLVQKCLILCNLKECYQRFKEKYTTSIGFSKFASLCPKECCSTRWKWNSCSVCLCNTPECETHAGWVKDLKLTRVSSFSWRGRTTIIPTFTVLSCMQSPTTKLSF